MSSHQITVIGYLLILTAVVLLEFAAHRPQSTIPTLGTLVGRITRTRSGRVAIFAAWFWLGLHYFAR